MNLTIIIKTFQRKNALSRLLKSIEKYYPNLSIIIVDDSKSNYKNYILKKFKKLNINYIVEKFNIGLSAGRNVLLNNVKTKYFLLCDDDFEFDDRTDLDKALKVFKNEKLDILGGTVFNRISLDSLFSVLWIIKDLRRLGKVLRKEEFSSIYNGHYDINNTNIKLLIDKNIDHFSEPKTYETDICSNFFIGNTKKILSIGGWTPEMLKVGEHEFFFLKAKQNNLKVCYTPMFAVRHFPKKSFGYMKFRFKAEQYFRDACREAGFNEFIVKDEYTNNIIYSYKK